MFIFVNQLCVDQSHYTLRQIALNIYIYIYIYIYISSSSFKKEFCI